MSEGWVQGLFFDGRRSRGYPARLRRQQQRLRIEYGDGACLEPELRDVRLGTRVGQAGCYLHLPEGAAFESPESDALAALLKGAKGERGSAWLRRLESSYRLILVSALAMLLMVTAGVLYGVPWVSRHIAHALPVELENVMGQSSLATLERMWLEPSALDETRRQHVQDAFAPHLARFAERYPEQPIEVRLHASPAIGANALALPGGIVIFTDDMLALAEHDDELVAILAHEVGHVVHRHGLRRVVQGSLVLWLVMAMTGDLSAASDLLVTMPAVLASLNYSRAMEREADDFALRYLTDNGIAPAHFAHILQRLEREARRPAGKQEEQAWRVPDVLSSHPPTPERIRRFLE